MRDGPLGDSGEPMLALRRELLQPPDLARLEPVARAQHPPRILLLYGSLRERSYSRLLVEEADRLLRMMGAETCIFDPRELPMANSTGPDHPKVQELRNAVAVVGRSGLVQPGDARRGDRRVQEPNRLAATRNRIGATDSGTNPSRHAGIWRIAELQCREYAAAARPLDADVHHPEPVQRPACLRAIR